ncbi:hypothetical protein [Streptomyces olivaceus]|uniref:hypothetical protein n=1 Tax=Streptomyces olivaceus TaxID=47716 RepID=UPI001CC982BC|nr:hypothetical protein [Streptomyces olivaceus]
MTLAPSGSLPVAAVPDATGLGGTHWFGLARPRTARPVPEASETTLVVEVRAVDVPALVRRRLRRAVRKTRN